MARRPVRAKTTSDPEVVLDLEWRDGMFIFRLIHRGTRPVSDVQVGFRRKVLGFGGAVDISALPLWTRLGYMPPGKVIEVPIDRAEGFLTRNKSSPLSVSVSYSDADAMRWVSTAKHDFSAYAGFPHILSRPEIPDG